MAKSTEQMAFVLDVAKLIQKADELGIGLTLGSGYRDAEEQAKMVERGLSKTHKSQHCERLAVDFNFFVNGALTYAKPDVQALGDYWESLHEKNRWGGSWRGLIDSGKSTFLDTPHFERQV